MTKTTTAAAAVTKVEPTTAADEAAKKRDEAEAAAPAKAKGVANKGALSVAVNLITMTGDDGRPVDVMPGTVFKPASVDLDFLKSHEAIRKPTDAEIALFEQGERARLAAAEGASADETLG